MTPTDTEPTTARASAKAALSGPNISRAEATALRQPFPLSELGFKPQNIRQGTAAALPHIDRAAVSRRLDQVFKPGNWSFRFEVIQLQEHRAYVQGSLYVRGYLVIQEAGEEISSKRRDGEYDDEYLLLSAVSNAFKRAASLLGVGRYLYGLPEIRVRFADYRFAEQPQIPFPILQAALALEGVDWQPTEADQASQVSTGNGGFQGQKGHQEQGQREPTQAAGQPTQAAVPDAERVRAFTVLVKGARADKVIDDARYQEIVDDIKGRIATGSLHEGVLKQYEHAVNQARRRQAQVAATEAAAEAAEQEMEEVTV